MSIITSSLRNHIKAPLSKSDQSLLCKVLREKLVPTQNELEVQQRDPNSPLYSVKSFEELNLRPDLLKGMTSSFILMTSSLRNFKESMQWASIGRQKSRKLHFQCSYHATRKILLPNHSLELEKRPHSFLLCFLE